MLVYFSFGVKMKIDSDQTRALDLVKAGHNVFITGPAGTGKTYTVRSIVEWVRSAGIPFGITATTGAAAILIGGKTLHSYLGIGLARKPVDQLVMDTKTKKKWILRKLLNTKLLIIDEVSMMSDELLDKVSGYLSELRKNPRPFGGIQVVFVGDFHQLPSVEGNYCFLSATWVMMDIRSVELQHNHRQDKDLQFQDILSRARVGTLTDEDVTTLANLRDTKWEDGILPTRLFSKNVAVDRINADAYEELITSGAKEEVYKTKFSGEKAKTWAASIGIKEQVALCVGAQVMITWNVSLDHEIVNGTRGIVVDVTTTGPHIRLRNGRTIRIDMHRIGCDEEPSIYVMTMPVRLAYSVSIHKSQGCTLDAVCLDLGPSIFADGQAYTALSRARSLDSIRITQVDARAFKTNKNVLEFYRQMRRE